MSNKRRPARQIPVNQTARPVSKDKGSVCVAFLHPGECSTGFALSLMQMMVWDSATSRRIKNVINEWSSANISAPRNSLTAKFLDEKGDDWLLWVDADMIFDHDAVDKILESADPVHRPIVGGLCFGSAFGGLFPTIYQMTTDADAGLKTYRVKDYESDALIGCAATGAAFLLIHKSVLIKIRDQKFNRTFPWFQELEISGEACGEDITFCLRAGAAGFPIYVNTSVKIGHHKSQILTEELFRQQQTITAPS